MVLAESCTKEKNETILSLELGAWRATGNEVFVMIFSSNTMAVYQH